MSISKKILSAILLAASTTTLAYLLYHPAPKTDPAVTAALATDLSRLDPAGIQSFVIALPLDHFTDDQKIALFQKLQTRYNAMSWDQKLDLLTRAAALMDKQPDGPLFHNVRGLMRAHFTDLVRTYRADDPRQRQKLLDEQIDQQENQRMLQKMRDAAAALTGHAPNPNDPMNPDAVRQHIAQSMAEGMNTQDPQDRAAVGQFFMDMKSRRAARGLANPW